MKKWVAITAVVAAAIFSIGDSASGESVRESIALRHSGGAKPVTTEHRSASSGSEVWRELSEGNRRFTRKHAEERRELAKGQHPGAVVLTCSDSRVPPELVFDQSLGKLFVIRVAGNTADRLALGSIEYALEHLHSKVLIVLGHDNCGAVKAALGGEKLPTQNLEALVERIRPALDPSSKDVAAAVAANVRRSASDLVANSDVIRTHVERNEVTLVKAVYHLASGNVETLN